MKRLPIFFAIQHKKIVVVGGGRSATIKIKTLFDFGGKVWVISPQICMQIRELFRDTPERLVEREFLPEDLQGVSLAFAAATKKVNEQVVEQARKHQILCCSVNGNGDFILPAYRKEGDLTVTVSTNGKFPLLGMQICKDVDVSMAKHLDWLEQKRQWVLENISDKEEKRATLLAFLEQCMKEEKEES